MAAASGNVLAIDIRVRPAPISAIVTRAPGQRQVRTRVAVGVGEAIAALARSTC